MNNPYYSDDSVTLYHGDCLEMDEWLASDVLVTDPPYGMGYMSNLNRDRRNVKVGRPIHGDTGTTVRDAMLESWGTRPGLVFGRWNCPRPSAVRHRLIWDKGNTVGMGDLSIPWGHAEEEIYVLGSGFSGKRESNVIRVQMLMSSDRNRPDHPTPKPIGLMERLIKKCPDGVIADPFAGSGSTLIAARNLGRVSVGVELLEEYCEMIANRLCQDVLDFGLISGMTEPLD